MSRIEILAPAGSPESLRAAAACGADAVYLGIDVLNARRNAANFTRENLAETVQYCHIRGLKVYLALNIILLEQELPTLVEVARAACEAGVDAAIVQDLGAAALLRRCCPGLRLNASTQMAVHNPEASRGWCSPASVPDRRSNRLSAQPLSRSRCLFTGRSVCAFRGSVTFPRCWGSAAATVGFAPSPVGSGLRPARAATRFRSRI